MQAFWLYYGITNGISLAMMAVDKFSAINGWRRIPEKWLLLFALPGGGVGGFIGMAAFRHKIRKPKFWLGFGACLILHIVFWILWGNGIL